jgi:hypothetical protein
LPDVHGTRSAANRGEVHSRARTRNRMGEDPREG